MKIKKKMLFCALLGLTGIANALEIGDEIYDNDYENIAIIHGSGPSAPYQVNIYAVSKKVNNNPQNISEALSTSKQTIDKKLWTITPDQLPITEHDCFELILDSCEGEKNCYQHCLTYPDPSILAFDEMKKKVYLNYPTVSVGVTGIGPSFLFAADINKREIKFLGKASWLEKGSLSPSGRYLVLYGFSIISIYDAKTNSLFDMNKSENDYSNSKKYVYHYLEFKKWDSDTKFTYVDVARYFLSSNANADPQPFISAKEVTYDIVSRTKLSDKAISEQEYEKFEKQDAVIK